jgi:hypothetical protein
MPAFPDTTLREDQLDPEYGGRPGNELGILNWAWLHGVVRFLSEAFLEYARVPWTTAVMISQDKATLGDVAVMRMDTFVPAYGYHAGKYSNGSTDQRFLGVFLESVSSGAKARFAIGGIIPPTITGLSSVGSPADVGVDPTNGRLRAAQPGDTIVGEMDIMGNFLPTQYGAEL